MEFRYIAVEGPPGVGKTAIAKKIADRLEGTAVLEEKSNPFLDDFRSGRGSAAFQSQIFFLLSRYRALSRLAQRELFRQLEITDFLLARDKIYAYLHLEDSELMLYERLYSTLAAEVPSPDLVVYLQAPADVLTRRSRARAERLAMQESELREVVLAYDYFFFHYSATPLLVVNTSRVDLGDAGTPIDDLVQEIQLMTGGTRFYVPTGV
jgi:deoxyadenosine/deoxycytidine kinase